MRIDWDIGREATQEHRKRVITWAMLIGPALLAVVLVLVATRDGVGLSSDSVIYISLARESAAGRGMVLPWGDIVPEPIGNRWAPLLPGMLAVIGRLGIDPVVSVRWLNALFFGGTVFLAGLIVRRASGSLWLSACCALFVATSRQMLAIHSMAWTEPAFIWFAMVALMLLAAYASTGRRLLLLVSCVAIVLGLFTRWAGASLIVTALACLLLGSGRLRNRILATACVGAMLFMPMSPGEAPWIRYISDHFSIAGLVLQPGSYEYVRVVGDLQHATHVIAGWLWPWILSDFVPGKTGCLLLTLLTIFVLGWMTVLARRSRAIRDRFSPAALRANTCWVLGIFLAMYPLFLLGSMVFFGKLLLTFDGRILLPLLVPGVLLGFLGGYSLWERAGRRRTLAVVALACCCGALLIRIPRALDRSIELAYTSGAGGQGYHDVKWRNSPTIAAINELPASVPVYSNAPDAIYILTGRISYGAAALINTYDEYGEYGYTTLPRLKEAQSKGGVVAYFDRLPWRGAWCNYAGVSELLPLYTVHKTGDGGLCFLAEPLEHSEALEEDRRLLGDDHPRTLNALVNMGHLLRSMGQPAKAEPYYREALEGTRRVLGDDDLGTLISLNNMGCVLQDMGKFVEAEPYYREALEDARRILGDNHPRTLALINNMGFLLIEMDRPVEALRYLSESSATARRIWTGRSERWRQNKRQLGSCLAKLGEAQAMLQEYESAEATLLEAQKLVAKGFGKDNTRTMRLNGLLADLYSDWHVVEPGQGYDTLAAGWRVQLEQWQATARAMTAEHSSVSANSSSSPRPTGWHSPRPGETASLSSAQDAP